MRVRIADDHEFIGRDLCAVLCKAKDVEFCAEAIDGRDALAKSLEYRPDIIIMDISMPRIEGMIEATQLLRKAFPQTKILSLSQCDIPEMVNEVEQAGAAAFVSKLLVWNKLVPSPEECSRVKRPFLRRRGSRCAPSLA
jgi:DNA-binding NarL/FixJ family response regulator